MRNTSVVPAAEVGLDDPRIVADRVGRALGDLLAEVQHRHAVGDSHHHRHVVLDQQQGEPALEDDLADEGGGVARLARRHAGGGLVEQQQGGAGGEGHADLEVALLAVRQVLRVRLDAPGVRREEPRDDVEEGGLAGAVRPDHREDLAGLDAEAHARQRGQRPEPLGDVVDLEDHAVARSREKIRRSPSRPRGMNRTMTMRTTPMTMKYQSTMDETLSRRIVKKTPPMIGPTRVPRPPIMTEMMNSPDSVHSIRSGVAKAERIG